MQSTITGLTSAINNLQQEHLTMNTRQDSITGTLEQVLSALQELKSANTTSSQIQSSMGVPSAPIRNRNNANTNYLTNCMPRSLVQVIHFVMLMLHSLCKV